MSQTEIFGSQIQNDTITNTQINSVAAIAITKIASGTANQLIGANAGATANEYKTLSGTTNEIIVTPGVGTITLSTPQAIDSTATPTFASETLTATTNQIVLGTTQTVTISAPTPATSSRTVTLPDLVGDYSVVGTIGAQTIAGAKTFTSDVTITNALTPGVPASASQISTGDPNTKALILKGNSYIPSSLLPNQVSGLYAWYKADALVLNNNDPVASWPDSSGNGNTVSQGTGSQQPIYKTAILNGLPAVLFAQGSNQFLSRASVLTWRTAIVVIRFATNFNVFSLGNSSGSNTIGFQAGTFNHIYNGGVITGNTHLTNNTSYLVTEQSDGVQPLFRVNGSADTAGMQNCGTGSGTLYVGAAYNGTSPFTGHIAEVCLYSGILNPSDLVSVEAGLATKYGISYAAAVSQMVNLEENQSPAGVALSAVDSFGRYVQATSAGTPTDIPVAGTTVYDTTGHILDIYDGGWKSTLMTSGGTLTGALTITPTTNQLILGTTRTATISAPTPATSSRIVTLPDLSGDYSVVGTIGTQTIGGAKTFSSILTTNGGQSITSSAATQIVSNMSVAGLAYLSNAGLAALTIQGFAGGVAGQILRFFNNSNTNNVTFVHNGSGTQTIYVRADSTTNLVIGPRGGATFVYDSVFGAWFCTGTQNNFTGLPNGTTATDAATFGQLPVFTDWAAYTPTITGIGTVNTPNFFWMQMGNQVFVNGSFGAGTVPASTVFSLTLPVGKPIASTKLTSVWTAQLGTFQAMTVSGGTTAQSFPTFGKVFYDNSDTLKVYFANKTGSDILVKATGDGVFSTGDGCTLNFSYPI